MSENPDRTSEERQPLSLEQLLRFKKSERPDDRFWADFDRELHQRIFQSVLQKRKSRLSPVFSSLFKPRLAYAMPVLAALMVALGFALTRDAGTASPEVSATVASAVDLILPVEASVTRAPVSAREKFVDDSLNLNLNNGSYRKVMSAQTMNVSSSSAIRYVADPLGTSGHSSVLSSGSTF